MGVIFVILLQVDATVQSAEGPAEVKSKSEGVVVKTFRHFENKHEVLDIEKWS